jgi:hypothetical protein
MDNFTKNKIQIKNSRKNSGYVVILATLFLMAISGTIVIGLSDPVVRQIKTGREVLKSREAYFLAEAGTEDILYRLNNNMSVSASETIILDGQEVVTTVTNSFDGKTVLSDADSDGYTRKIQTNLVAGVGASFNYGVQAGAGGFLLQGGSRVNGNVYSNGDIDATNGVVITGSAVAANSAAIFADQVNDTPLPPGSSVTFANVSSSQDFAQSFQVATTSQANYVQFYIRKVGSPSNATVRIVADNGSGSPSSTVLDTATLGDSSGAGAVGTSYSWVNATFSSNAELTPGVTYWLVIDGSTHSSRYYVLAANNTYAGGGGKLYNGSAWVNTSPSGLDGYFKLYLGGLTSQLGGGNWAGAVVVGTGGVGDAWAHTVRGASVAGNLYCQVGASNNKPCDTSRPDPSPQGFPISDANIATWKAEATDGITYNGNVTVGWQGTTTGPIKINGDLTLNGGGELNMTGTIWVTGNVNITSGGSIVLDPGYATDSGVLLADGRVSLSGGGELSGSGQAGSYILLLTTSNCPDGVGCGGSPAMSISGGAGSLILSAQEGTMSLSGGVEARGTTAKRITATGGTEITYETGLANVNFSSGPGGAWNVVSWKEVQ